MCSTCAVWLYRPSGENSAGIGPGQHLAQATDAANVLGQVVRDQDDQGVRLLQTAYHLAPGGGGSLGGI